MKQKILKVYKCQLCNSYLKYIMRSDSVNNNITDSDIMRIATNYVNDDKFEECVCCKRNTVQVFVGLEE